MDTGFPPLTPVPAAQVAAQVGMLIAGRIRGDLDADYAATVRACHLGGAVLFADNIGTPDETRVLTARIQELRALTRPPRARPRRDRPRHAPPTASRHRPP